MLVKKDVIELFNILLKRNPENEKVIESKLRDAENRNHLMKIIVNSEEFKKKRREKEEFLKNNTFECIFIFLHIPKTAGTLLRENWFFKNKTIIKNYFWLDSSLETNNDVYERYKNYYSLLSLNLIGGHWFLNNWLKFPILQNKLIIGIVREPLKQVLSHYNYIKNIDTSHPLNKFIKNKSLIEVVEDINFNKHLLNLQLKYLFHPNNVLCHNDQVIIGKHEKLDDFVVEINRKHYIGDIDLKNEKANVGGNYINQLKEEEGYNEAIAILKELLRKEYDFYNSFDSVLKLNYKEYDILNAKFS